MGASVQMASTIGIFVNLLVLALDSGILKTSDDYYDRQLGITAKELVRYY